MGINIEKPLMIIGIGRSGTTLLQAMLNAHPEVCFPPESHFIRDFVANAEMQRIYNEKGLDAIEQLLSENEYIQRLNVETKDALTPFVEHKEEFSFGNLFKRYLYLYAKNKGRKYIGEKDPSNLYYLQEIKRIFPGAIVVHIIRDPRDVISSRLNTEMGIDKSLQEWAFDYRRGFVIARSNGQQLFGNNYVEIYYEDLLSDPKSVLNNLCEKIGMPFDKRMLSFQEKAQDIVADNEMGWKENIFKPIIKNNAGKWEMELNKKQVRAIEIICNKVFRETKYRRSNISIFINLWGIKCFFVYLFKVFLKGILRISQM